MAFLLCSAHESRRVYTPHAPLPVRGCLSTLPGHPRLSTDFKCTLSLFSFRLAPAKDKIGNIPDVFFDKLWALCVHFQGSDPSPINLCVNTGARLALHPQATQLHQRLSCLHCFGVFVQSLMAVPSGSTSGLRGAHRSHLPSRQRHADSTTAALQEVLKSRSVNAPSLLWTVRAVPSLWTQTVNASGSPAGVRVEQRGISADSSLSPRYAAQAPCRPRVSLIHKVGLLFAPWTCS